MALDVLSFMVISPCIFRPANACMAFTPSFRLLALPFQVMRGAHEEGLCTTSTIMFGHVDNAASWARHLLLLRDLQQSTGGFTEFVPLPFVHMEAPLYIKGRSRRGPTLRECILMHAGDFVYFFHTAKQFNQCGWSGGHQKPYNRKISVLTAEFGITGSFRRQSPRTGLRLTGSNSELCDVCSCPADPAPAHHQHPSVLGQDGAQAGSAIAAGRQRLVRKHEAVGALARPSQLFY